MRRLRPRKPLAFTVRLAVALLAAEGSGSARGAESVLAAVNFYPGHVVGRENLPTGLLDLGDDDRSTALSWPELITSGIDVDGNTIALACGNGVLASRDAGQTWRLTGGARLAEIQRIRFDRRNNRRAFAAGAYGIFRTEDLFAPGAVWEAVPAGIPLPFANDVLQDAGDPETWWVASEAGVFVTRDGGDSFARVSAPVPVRALLEEPDSGCLWAATDGAGLLVSTDRAKNWDAVPIASKITYSIVSDPRDTTRLAVGSVAKIHLSDDGGLNWRSGGEGLPAAFSVYALAFGDEGALYAGGSGGVFVSRDRGETFRPFGLVGAHVRDVVCVGLPSHRSEPVTREIVVPAFGSESPLAPRDESEEFVKRRDELLNFFAADRPDPQAATVDLWRAIARVRSGRVDDALLALIDRTLAHPRHSMFFSLPLIALWLHGEELFPNDLRARCREVLTTVPIYRGDTENHWVMHYTALLLAAESFSDTPADTWYDGRTSAEKHWEARGFLLDWARLTARRGQGEFDSPSYLFMFVTPMLLLHDFAREKEMRLLARMVLDLLLADYFSESLAGAWGGAHSRIYEPEVFFGSENRVAAYHWLYAGGIDRPMNFPSWLVAAACASYVAPQDFAVIANQRDRPYSHREIKRVRNVIRYGNERNPPVHKTTTMTRDWVLGSLQGGILQPIQQHSWDVTWRSSTRNPTVFTVHPYTAAHELAMFFPEDPHRLVGLVDASKQGYASNKKWVSSSPCEFLLQDHETLLALYLIPDEVVHREVSLYWPDILDTQERSGWRVGRDADFELAVFACQEGVEEPADDHVRVRYRGTLAGFVVVVGEQASRAPLGRGPELRRSRQGATLTWTKPDGRELRVGSDRLRDLRNTRLFDGPFLSSELDSGVVDIGPLGRRRTYDFEKIEIR